MGKKHRRATFASTRSTGSRQKLNLASSGSWYSSTSPVVTCLLRNQRSSHRLENVIDRVGLFLDPVIAVEAPAEAGEVAFWTPNGLHRLSALRRLGADHIVAEQFNPAMELVFPASGSRVHSIVGTRSVRR